MKLGVALVVYPLWAAGLVGLSLVLIPPPLSLLDDPVYILKRELLWVPIWGWYAAKAKMIAVDRSSEADALRRLAPADVVRVWMDRALSGRDRHA